MLNKLLDWIAGHPNRTSNVSSSQDVRDLGTAAVTILNENFAVDDQDRIQHAWWQIYDHATKRVSYRVLICEELRMPFTGTKLDPDLLNWANSVLYNLYSITDCDVICIFGNCYAPDPLVTQLYGSAVESTNLDEAVAKARVGQDVVRSLLEVRYKLHLEKPTTQLWRTIKNQLGSLPQMLCLNGHAEPQLSNRIWASQNAELLRGLVSVDTQFLFVVQAHPLPQKNIIEAQLRQGRQASFYASRQRGVSSTSMLLDSDPVLSVSHNWEDDVAIRLTNQARGLANILSSAEREGGWLASVWLLSEDNNVVTTKDLVSRVFGGSSYPAVAHVIHEAEREALQPLLMALRGDRELAADLESTGALWNRHATLLPSSMLGVFWVPYRLTDDDSDDEVEAAWS